jgi:hypothetical protein
MSTELAIKKIIGTSGALDYVLVAEGEFLKYGFKVLVGVKDAEMDDTTKITTLTLGVGLRIRAVRSAEDKVYTIQNVVKDECPFLKWTRLDQSRASCIIIDETITTKEWTTKEHFIDGILRHPEGGKRWKLLAEKFHDEYTPINTLAQIEEHFRSEVTKAVNGLFEFAAKHGHKFGAKGGLNNVVPLTAK